MNTVTGPGRLAWPDRDDVDELGPMLRRLERADPSTMVRMKLETGRVSAFAVLSTEALVGRTIAVAQRDSLGPETDAVGGHDRRFDATTSAAEIVAWLDGGPVPSESGPAWLRPLPPPDRWQRVDAVPEAVVRDVVRLGAAAHEEAGLALGQRAAQNLLDTPVLTVSDGTVEVELTNRSLSALASMGFLVAGSHVVVAICGRWTRVAAPFGSVFAQNRADGLSLL